jgi:hypothetical protein
MCGTNNGSASCDTRITNRSINTSLIATSSQCQGNAKSRHATHLIDAQHANAASNAVGATVATFVFHVLSKGESITIMAEIG